MLTLFSIPKAFSGHIGIIQHNALASWVRLGGGNCEIILLGDEPGVAEAAASYGVRHVPEIRRSVHGTPILSDMIAQVEAIARDRLLCLVNADIILFDDVLHASERASNLRESFLLVASRFNLKIEAPVAFGENWATDLRARAVAENRMFPSGGSDIFVYPRGLLGEIPPFSIGRGYWDNWLMFRARQRGASLIDATAAVVTVHQDHDYAHIPGFSGGDKSDAPIYAGEEGASNLALAGGRSRVYTMYDATEVLTDDFRLVRTFRNSLARRRLRAWARRWVTILLPGLSTKLGQIRSKNRASP